MVSTRRAAAERARAAAMALSKLSGDEQGVILGQLRNSLQNARTPNAGGGHRGVDPLKIFINEFCHPSVSSFGAEGQSAQLSCLLPFLIFPYFSGST